MSPINEKLVNPAPINNKGVIKLNKLVRITERRKLGKMLIRVSKFS